LAQPPRELVGTLTTEMMGMMMETTLGDRVSLEEREYRDLPIIVAIIPAQEDPLTRIRF
jgi:hypothetical protein